MTQMDSGEGWDAVKRRLPLGRRVRGVVEVRRPFGFFVNLREAPGIAAIVDVISYCPDGEVADPVDWPTEGEEIEAVVSDHRDLYHQIRLRVGPPFSHLPIEGGLHPKLH
ncbi:hypothetical protein GCM10010420_44760 [Streptomyces glaucosporus]|uniref:S1 motif domain-containing protein n=1 Tax=Streptomyces glaucosporus TaxID=284044 RepID=A0ABN3IQD6_9ACTN